MRGDKPFASLGTMLPRMRALALSQDKIGWRNFTEGCISTHFYFIQHYHLALSGSYLNGSDWTKSLISKLLHITHSQWIYRNFTLHDKLCGYLHNKSLEDIKQTIGATCQQVKPRSRTKSPKGHIKVQQSINVSYSLIVTDISHHHSAVVRRRRRNHLPS